MNFWRSEQGDWSRATVDKSKVNLNKNAGVEVQPRNFHVQLSNGGLGGGIQKK